MTTSEPPPLNEDQRALQDTLRAFLADQLPPKALRAALETQAGYSLELHAHLAGQLGLAGLTIPAEFGGFARSQAEANVMHAELGRALYPGPFLPSALTAGVLLATENRAAQEHWLPLLARGSVTGTVAAAGEAGFWTPGPDTVRAVQAAGGWRLYGHRWFVVAAHVADIVVVPALTEAGLGIFLAETRALGFTASGQLGLDLTRRVCVTAFDEVPAVLLAQGEAASAALEQAERDFLLATAAEAAGGIGWCLDATIAYAKDREQFGPPNGSFAALAQACVDMLAQFQDVSATARAAAISAADGSGEAPVAAHVAALRAGEAYRAATESATRLFGGVGVSWEHDAHLYYRRAWSAERLSGGPQAHRAAIIGLHGPVGLAGL
jgi:alkylation response protein AidB-like acyl-CoA dehydrogenase